ncbi:hypothetical protein N9181_01070 [bacterium]|nr:hypothetical protein [bacterium]
MSIMKMNASKAFFKIITVDSVFLVCLCLQQARCILLICRGIKCFEE